MLPRIAALFCFALLALGQDEPNPHTLIPRKIMGNAAQRTGAQVGLDFQTIGEGGPYAEARNLVRQAYLREG